MSFSVKPRLILIACDEYNPLVTASRSFSQNTKRSTLTIFDRLLCTSLDLLFSVPNQSQASFFAPMAFRAQLLALIVPLSSALVTSSANDTAASDTTSTYSSCTLEDVYLRPNASNSYAIPAIVQDLSKPADTSSNTITSSLTETWQIINALGQSAHPYSHQNNTQELEQLLLLDTSRSQSNASAIPPALVGCSFVFDLPQSDIGKADNGSCASLVGQQCVNDIHTAAQTLAAAAAKQNGTDLFPACTAISNGLATLPKSCPKKSTASETGFSISELAGIDLTYNAASDCPGGPKTVPIPIHDQIAVNITDANHTIYDQWARTTKPVLMAFFSNGTIFHGSAFADTRLLCTTPRNVAAGSHNPTSGAEHSASVDPKSMVAMFLGMNAFLFFML